MQTEQLTSKDELEYYLVVHPLDDVPEQKLKSDHLAPMEMTSSARWSLVALRLYLILMMGLFFYHLCDLAGQVVMKR
ncbi:MAG TPA: hypothetical protein VIH58_13820 [Chthoniobacterales bacterium]|jgi:hypothetical protein